MRPVVPARAGVIPVWNGIKTVTSSGSRASGGDPLVMVVNPFDYLWFPRERGGSLSLCGFLGCVSVVPARAGGILSRELVVLDRLGGSRASGGDPHGTMEAQFQIGWFPRERG